MTVTLGVVDIEKALVTYLAASADLTAAGCRRVSTDIGGPYPMLRVTRTGGPFDSYRIDRPAVLIEAWGELDGNDDAACQTVMRTALALVTDMPKANLTDVTVTWVAHLTSNQRSPDTATNQQRRLSSVVITAHAKP